MSSTERVTAGLPSLSPSVRFQHDRRAAKTDYVRSIQSEMDKKCDDAASPYGNRLASVWAARVGTPLHSSEIIRRLTALNPSLLFERNPYFPVMQLRVKDGKGGSTFVCGFEADISPEWCVPLVHLEEQIRGFGADAKLVTVKVADGHTRGWRKVIETCIERGLIGQSAAERVFGVPNSISYKERIRNPKNVNRRH